ncbi:MAG: hypothetical protein IIZ75_10475, partial [Lachnospiraceae bacterium]|nr:hypothetical protein [Lachnospiraceae bacterium]
YMTLLEHYKEEREEGRKEGRSEERINGIRIFIKDKLEDNVPKSIIIDKLMKNYGLNAEEAERYVTKYSASSTSDTDNP